METNKALTAEQLNMLRGIVRQRFDDLYHRIGTSRQKLANTVLVVDQSINKELTKEKIDAAREKQILNKVREIEREANNQLPHVHKIAAPTPGVAKPIAVKAQIIKTPAVKTPVAKSPAVKATKEPKEKKEAKTKTKPKKK